MPTNKELEQQLKSSQDENQKLAGMLSSVMDRLEKIENPETMKPAEGILKVKISTYRKDNTDEPKVVTSWRTLKNDVRVVNNTTLIDQQTEITLEDESKVKMTTEDFYKLIEKDDAEVIIGKSDIVEIQLPQNNGTGYRMRGGEVIVRYKGRELSLLPSFLN